MTQPLRLALLPLDERPINAEAPGLLGRIANCEVITPPREMLPDMKQTGRFTELGGWLRSVAGSVDGLIVSIEMLAFGGLIPSRISHISLDQARQHVAVLKEIKEKHKGLPIFAFAVVMRIPSYDLDEQEPAYWAQYGSRIHRYSQLVDRVQRHNEQDDRTALETLKREIPAEVLEDWHWRRDRNHRLSHDMLEFTKDGIIDFLLITQDDSSEYGVSAAEQRALRARIAELRLEDRAVIYPGADEVAMVLLARHVNRHLGKRPKMYPRYSSVRGPFIIPRYEDRPLGESVKGQVYAVGGRLVETPQEADVMLFLNTPGDAQAEAWEQDRSTSVDTASRNLLDFTESILHYSSAGIPVAVADVAYSNGGETRFVSLLLRRVGLQRLAAYAAWNTAGNTLGTAVAQGSLVHAVGPDAPLEVRQRAAVAHFTFLLARFIDDWGYQGVVRTQVTRNWLQPRGINPLDVGDRWREVQDVVAQELIRFAQEVFHHHATMELHWYGQPVHIRPKGFVIDNVWQPWQRMFNVGFRLKLEI